MIHEELGGQPFPGVQQIPYRHVEHRFLERCRCGKERIIPAVIAEN